MEGNHSVLIQDGPSSWLLFRDPCETVRAETCADVGALLETVAGEVENGLIAAGFLGYESAAGMDSALRTHEPTGLPAAWFGLYDRAERLQAPPSCGAGFSISDWRPSVTEDEYRAATDQIMAYIRAGDTYQVNYTIRLHAMFSGNPYAYFLGLCRAQRATNCAFVRLDDMAVCSASPELFFRLTGDTIESRPMKGTVARGMTLRDDRERADWLRSSEKNRAENIMIVDMVRNDIGRVAEFGSVHVPETFEVERYPTVFQMTSTVRARTSARFPEIARAIFPCASITGAPKVRTMQIINELESTPRGIYTGSIGFLGQGGAPGLGSRDRVARFNVAIRTVVIDTKTGRAEYGVGGGIVWDSESAAEYAECLTKAEVLNVDRPKFRLLETILWQGDAGFFLLDRHLARLAASAEYFGYDVSTDRVRGKIDRTARTLRREPRVLRLLVDAGGGVEIQEKPVPRAKDGPFKLAVARDAVMSDDPFIYHKTTNRAVYERARARAGKCDDVVLYNERGEVTEATIANLVIDLGGQRVTPPVASGLLAGTFREQLLAQGEIVERIVTLDDLAAAEALYLINSVRKWVTAELCASDGESCIDKAEGRTENRPA